VLVGEVVGRGAGLAGHDLDVGKGLATAAAGAVASNTAAAVGAS
jgi:hypothetical protein